MENSKKFLAKSDFIPYISFKEQASHTVKLLNDKEDTIMDKATGKLIPCVKYLVEEQGQKKSFSTTSLGLVEKLAKFSIGDIVTITLGSKKGANGFVSVYEVHSDKLPLTKVEPSVDPINESNDISPEISPEEISW